MYFFSVLLSIKIENNYLDELTVIKVLEKKFAGPKIGHLVRVRIA